MTKHSLSIKIFIWIISILLVISIAANVYLFISQKNLSEKEELLKKCNLDSAGSNFELLSPDIAWLSVDEFLDRRQYFTVSYTPMKSSLTMVLDNAQGDYSLYFEDLTTGAWIGINEKEEFVPLSLLKLPTMVATLKEIELGYASLNDTIILQESDMDKNSGELWKKGAGYEITIRELLTYLIKHSDNTALLTLNRRVVSDTTFVESRLAMGLPAPKLETESLTAKEYSNILRGLYFSNYLRRTFSELGLTLMLETDFNSQIPAGVPPDIKVAHKVGFYHLEGYYHDCGIVYAPNKPYILCVMSKNTNAKEADRVISQVSKIIYSYVTSNSTINYNSTRN